MKSKLSATAALRTLARRLLWSPQVPRPVPSSALSALRLPAISPALSLILLSALLAASAAPACAQQGTAVLLPIEGPIGPATSDHFTRALSKAGESGAALVIVRLDTPGGLVDSTRDMVRAILASPVPVVVYVAPGGARAASAGTYLVYASHYAAMAPGTNLGAATPVNIDGGPAGDGGSRPADPPKGVAAAPLAPSDPGSASERKAINDSVAYIRSLAELRGRNADWAERAVREGASLTAERALEAGVVESMAADLPALLSALDGREFVADGKRIRLETRGLVVVERSPDWRTRLLSLVTNPNLAYLLLLIGIYGLLLEGYHPGAVLPGVVGAISLLLALFALQVLSVNYTGLAFIALGVLLIVAESLVPAFGALGIGGIVAFVFGSIMLLDSGVPGFEIARSLIGGIALVASALLLTILSYAVRARRRPVVSGAEGLLNETAEAVESFEAGTHAGGRVRVHGEVWNAVSAGPVHAGQRLRILRIDGLTLEVEPAPE